MNTIKFRNSNNYSNYNFRRKIKRNSSHVLAMVIDLAIQRADWTEEKIKTVKVLWLVEFLFFFLWKTTFFQ